MPDGDLVNVYHLLQAIYWACLASTCAVAWSKGASLEKLGAGVLTLTSVLGLVITPTTLLEYASAQPGVLLLDLGLLGALLFILLNSDRFWPIWASGFHLVGVATHLAKLSYPDILPQAYWAVQGLWAYPIMAAIVLGARRSTRELRIGSASPR